MERQHLTNQTSAGAETGGDQTRMFVLRHSAQCAGRRSGDRRLHPVWLLRARHPDDAVADGEAKLRLLPARGLLLRLRLPRLARLAWRRILLRPLRLAGRCRGPWRTPGVTSADLVVANP